MTNPGIDRELLEQFEEAAAQAGCELLHAEFKGGMLRLVLDHEDGVDLSHCETVSRQVSALLDVADWGPGSYTLEVTSPGLDRQLYRPADYERFAGERVRVTWKSPEMPTRKTVVGRLKRWIEAAQSVEVELDDEALEIPYRDIQLARLAPEF